ncbi:5-bromo-4-chloroindolyl phosphate hydrolysis family protein [Mesorhizobium sp. CO1-1-7]|uniref:5-bromo-4-chloroindolyl phosphate hydrolysis family protein n=1 Tax=unclassified Mesorhizobium TaxID=325217 RepID=UPI0011278C80|nr:MULTISPECIES: 5-bromo-4-chloroindolyl phosphate hydrolysis family protein [unclassified Mesorhizobium]MBZ9744407.1 5-bromo-4-chloroindolyl phosphate hydrolysis family protein [Mesorhizobium sp. CO1-1-7]MBZ9757821.1 5-bromo-4-chloroindolyl phosphate hydrolysis family protein [Mesorhizobium sp. ESP6-5]TPK23591.1 5-bromo-4-chloroindolyl phosphate hydrolase [Mesorhizobium sp. B2-5-9]TPK83671.1 5-bromo-4-chloroindolyl phosphate hydrolase [Mesorhizobium sp. B2-4-13]TPL72196.1 5-bromo-4-chloroindo
MRGLFGNDWNWIAAGGISAVLLVGLGFLTQFPFLVSAIIAALVFAGLVFVLAPRQLFEGLDLSTLSGSKVAFARELLAQAQPAADRLSATAGSIADKDMKAKVKNLSDIAADVISKVETKPETAPSVRRFLTYYVPQAAEVAEGYATLANRRAPSQVRLANVGAVITKLQDAFVHYADSLADSELGTLDVDLRLIQESLKEDIGR